VSNLGLFCLVDAELGFVHFSFLLVYFSARRKLEAEINSLAIELALEKVKSSLLGNLN